VTRSTVPGSIQNNAARLMNVEKGSIQNNAAEDTLQYQEVKDQLPCHLWSMLSMYFL